MKQIISHPLTISTTKLSEHLGVYLPLDFLKKAGCEPYERNNAAYFWRVDEIPEIAEKVAMHFLELGEKKFIEQKIAAKPIENTDGFFVWPDPKTGRPPACNAISLTTRRDGNSRRLWVSFYKDVTNYLNLSIGDYVVFGLSPQMIRIKKCNKTDAGAVKLSMKSESSLVTSIAHVDSILPIFSPVKNIKKFNKVSANVIDIQI